jgi:hypothetical protein
MPLLNSQEYRANATEFTLANFAAAMTDSLLR